MVFVNEKKYSCEACIKGHRSSSCKHTDRPLFEIKKKGRPITQCEHCRELRKTKQVHVKCICQGKSPLPEEKGKKGSLKKVLASAAYPHGLPSSVEDADAHPPSEPSSDSDHSNTHNCGCKDGEDCHCFTLKHHPRRKSAGSDPGPSLLPLAPLSGSRTSTNLRPVLPKPAQPLADDPTQVLAPRPHLPRSTHGNTFFSPYGRAYDEHFTASSPHSADQPFSFVPLSDQSSSSHQATSPTSPGIPDTFPSTSPLPDHMQWPLQSLAAPACACGDSCACPGCVEHRGASGWFTRECANPGLCTTCFACLTDSRPAPPPAPTPPTTPLGMRPSREFEQWMDSLTGATPAFFPGLNALDVPAVYPNGSPQHSSTSTLDMLALPANCTGLCVPGQCTCIPDSGSECQRDASPFFDANITSAMLPPPFDLDMDLSSFELPDMSPRARSSSFPYYAESNRPSLPRASSTTSLLPMIAQNGASLSLTSRVFPARSSSDGLSNQVEEPQRTSEAGASSPTPRRNRAAHTGAFFEAAARRFGG